LTETICAKPHENATSDILWKGTAVMTPTREGIDSARPAWHAMTSEQALRAMQSSRSGLTDDDAATRMAQYGPNKLPSKPPPGIVLIFLHQFLSPLIYILIVAGLVSLALREWTDAGFIFAVIFLNASLGTFQEWKAEKSAASLQRLLRIVCRCRRNGQPIDLEAESLVPGDIVILESGNRVPADLRLFESNSLLIDESLLTGESQAVAKDLPPLPLETPLSDRNNLAFAGSTVTLGRGLGLVVATGKQTEVGQIASAVASTISAKPPLVIRMEKFARQVSYLVLGFVLLLAAVAILEGMPFKEVFFMAVALAVSAIPEGLPVAMTVALSIATSRMARRNVIVRRLTAVEGLGSCTCIASDKTGTLTVNRQTVKALWVPSGENYTVSGEGYAGVGEVQKDDGASLSLDETHHLKRLAKAGILCNEASLKLALGEWVHHGDAIDVAILAFAHKLGLDPEEEVQKSVILGEIPFESEQRYAARFVHNQQSYCIVKGAVEQVLDFCSTMDGSNGRRDLDILDVEGEALRLASSGYRVLAIAEGNLPETSQNFHFGPAAIPKLTLLGLVAFIDPLRPEVIESLDVCRKAGVRVVMITGDHPATALGIARELKLASDGEALMTGKEFTAIEHNPEAILKQVSKTTVFARVAPLQKLSIVNALNQLGHFTAVTGDGVNDAPALRKAHIGVAMGTGTDVAKETASIIVADDNFASLVAGIEEGRFAYDNIRKVVYLLISTGGAEIVLFTLALLFGLPLPLGAVQLLWLNLVTNGIQDIALAFEGGEPGVMHRPPRRPNEGIFNQLMISQTLVSGIVMGILAFCCWHFLLTSGMGVSEARNSVLLLMVLLENVHVFNCRSERISAFRVPFRKNPLLIGGVLTAQSIHILSMHLPFMQTVLDIQPVSWVEWSRLLVLAGILLLAMELFKLMKKTRKTL
jgi:magnesium-transporting ATPase (P-type)